LASYAFPGNVRELESEMGRLVALAEAEVACDTMLLNERIRIRGNCEAAVPSEGTTIAPMSLQEMEKQLICSVLRHTAGNRTRAAEVLGISREGLRTKLQRLQLSAPPDSVS
jgi:DNA-binding NtrC family response regulator